MVRTASYALPTPSMTSARMIINLHCHFCMGFIVIFLMFSTVYRMFYIVIFTYFTLSVSIKVKIFHKIWPKKQQ